MDGFLEFLNSYSVMITIAGIMIIAFARSIIRIFRMGVTFKTELATKDEMREFEAEMRRDMRGYCIQIQKVVTDAAMNVINNKLKDIEDVKHAAEDMRVMKAQIEAEIKVALEKYDEMKAVSDNVRVLTNKVQRLEYGADNRNDRRKE